MKLCLTTDLHMNRWPMFLNRSLLSKAKNCDALLILGDITTGLHTEEHLSVISKHAKDVYFVLGNHDFYTSSFQEMTVRVKQHCKGTNLHWLDNDDPIEIAPGTWLVGVDGWYDGVVGDSFFMDLNFDRMLIKDLLIKRRPEDRAEIIMARAAASADDFTAKMQMIPADAKNIIVATHYPPWMGPVRSILDAFWIPQSVNTVLADRICEEAAKRENYTRFDVFCGHVHRPYKLQPAENVFCTVLDSRTTKILSI
jgi:UDP-2,3-diacylglucosamine pyrophosphatase LpxH